MDHPTPTFFQFLFGLCSSLADPGLSNSKSSSQWVVVANRDLASLLVLRRTEITQLKMHE